MLREEIWKGKTVSVPDPSPLNPDSPSIIKIDADLERNLDKRHTGVQMQRVRVWEVLSSGGRT